MFIIKVNNHLTSFQCKIWRVKSLSIWILFALLERNKKTLQGSDHHVFLK
jgi:hypothetical protein